MVARRRRRRRRRKGQKKRQVGAGEGGLLEGVQAVGKMFNPSGKRRPKGFARAVLSGRSRQFKKNFISKYGCEAWHWG